VTIEERYPNRPGVHRVGPVWRWSLTARRNARDERWAAALDADVLGECWRQACEAIPALSRRTETPSGQTVSTPRMHVAEIGPPVRIMVQLRPGMLPSDVTDNARRLGAALGGRAARVVGERGGGWIVVEILHGADPLTRPVAMADLAPVLGGISLGRDESGATVGGAVQRWPHGLISGATGSGKSAGLRWLLVQLAGRDDVHVVGSDITGLLWRPWPPCRDRVSGSADVEAHVAMLERLVVQMNERLALMPEDADVIETHAGLPLVLCVIEEYPGLLQLADATDKDMAKRVRSAVSRLLAEARKVGIRVWIIAQRGDAKILGGFERSNLPLRITYSQEPEGVRMTHPGAPREAIEDHAVAPAGVALFSAPGSPMGRFRSPWCSFADYAAAVRGVSRHH
jgi:S-DNA-T family DNA segregation ATPase FtsK/SpoIIIE